MQSLHPKYFKTPEGRAVSIKTMAAALKAIKQNPSGDYKGWNWYPTTGYLILAEFRRGLHDRINRRVVVAQS